jgi:hypothetical protein
MGGLSDLRALWPAPAQISHSSVADARPTHQLKSIDVEVRSVNDLLVAAVDATSQSSAHEQVQREQGH